MNLGVLGKLFFQYLLLRLGGRDEEVDVLRVVEGVFVEVVPQNVIGVGVWFAKVVGVHHHPDLGRSLVFKDFLGQTGRPVNDDHVLGR